jgi:hypothetical protein
MCNPVPLPYSAWNPNSKNPPKRVFAVGVPATIGVTATIGVPVIFGVLVIAF